MQYRLTDLRMWDNPTMTRGQTVKDELYCRQLSQEMFLILMMTGIGRIYYYSPDTTCAKIKIDPRTMFESNRGCTSSTKNELGWKLRKLTREL